MNPERGDGFISIFLCLLSLSLSSLVKTYFFKLSNSFNNSTIVATSNFCLSYAISKL